MAKCKLLMQTGQVQKIIDFFDGYSDDKVSCKYVKKVGIKAEFECETELYVCIEWPYQVAIERWSAEYL